MDCQMAQSVFDQIDSLLRTPGFQEHIAACEGCKNRHLANANNRMQDCVRDKVESAEPDVQNRDRRANSFSSGVSCGAFGDSL